jgi:gluconolactonase
MKPRLVRIIVAIGVLSAFMSTLSAQHAVRQAIDGRPDATIDLRTADGAALVKAQWRYRDARPVEVSFMGPGPDLKPTGAPVKTLDQPLRAGATDFDDSTWEVVDASSLDQRRSNGKQSFAWYRTSITIPQRVGALSTKGSTAVFEVVVDDYAEVWVNGQLPRTLGQTGGAVISGFNAPNRLVLTRDAQPGQRFQLAIFAANGPLSDPPSNFIWIRSASIDLYQQRPAASTAPVRVVRKDPALDAIVPPNASLEKLAEGFLFSEGPVWSPEGFLLFSDPNANTIYRWSDDEGLSVFRAKSGYTGADIGEYGQPGSNGLAIDSEGRLTINEHGNRRVTRLEKNGVITVLADRFEGKRLNSPNDLVYRSDGSLYFTDPPFGLPKFFDDPRKELGFSGVYCLSNGTLTLVSNELTGPNGIAFSPDERFLYVGNWDEKKKVVMRYEVKGDCAVGSGTVFFDMTAAPGEDAIDGVKTDRLGNVYVSGPGGLWIISPDGRHLGTIDGLEHAHNFAWGDADGRTLYLTARTGLYRLRLNVSGRPLGPGTTQ